MKLSSLPNVLIVVTLGVIAAGLQAQTVRAWVSATGIDNASCSRSNPCRTFGAAITAVNNGGEVVALDSGGYGPFVINKAVIITAPQGVHAAIAPTMGDAIFIPFGGDFTVVLRNLFLNGQGAVNGIHIHLGATTVVVEDSVISGFTQNGIRCTAVAALMVSNTVVRNCQNIGIFADEVVNVGIDHCRLEKNFVGLLRRGGKISVSETVAQGNSSIGFEIRPASSIGELILDSCVARMNGTGIEGLTFTNTSVSRSVVSANSVGIHASGGTIRVSDTTVIGNVTGLATTAEGVLSSRTNNTVEGNGTDGAFTATFLPK